MAKGSASKSHTPVLDTDKLASGMSDLAKAFAEYAASTKNPKSGGPMDTAKIVADEANELADHVFGGLHEMSGILERIPFIGGALTKSLGVDKIIAEGRAKIKSSNVDLEKGAINSMGHLNNVSKAQLSAHIKAFTNPIFLLIAAGKLLVERFVEVDAAGEEFRKTTGLVNSQMADITRQAVGINVQFARMGVTITEAFKAAAAIVKTFQVASVQTGTLMKNTALMAANIGIAEEDSAKTFKMFLGMSGMSVKMANNASVLTAKLSELAGVAPAEVFKDLANASSDVINFVGKTPKQLILSTIEARRLGTTIESIAKSARGMVDFQGSINAEMEASVLIGRNMNFQLSRQLAWEGKIVESREEALRQIELAGDWDKKNVFQREAMAKAANMEVADVTKMIAQKKLLNNLSAKGVAMYQKMQKEAENLKNLDDDRVTAEADAYVINMMRQSEMKKLKDSLSAGLTAFADALMPIAKALMPVVKIVAGVLLVAFRFIGAILRGFMKPIDAMVEKIKGFANAADLSGDMFENVLSWVDKIGEAIGFLAGSVLLVVSMFGKGEQFITWISSFKTIQVIVEAIGGSMLWLGKLSMGIINPFAKFMGMAAKAVSFFGATGSKIFGIIGPLLRIGSIFVKWIPIVGWIITGIQFVFSLIKRLVAGEGWGAIKGALLDTFWQPFVDAWNWIRDIFVGHSPSKLGAGIVKGIESIQDMLFDALLWPFKTAWDFIGKIFGMESLGTKIVAVFKRILSIIRTMLNPVAWIGKMFSSDAIASRTQPDLPVRATANTTASDAADKSGDSALSELAKAVTMLTEKVALLSNKSADEANTNVAGKLQELIEMFKSGGIAVNMDGRKVSEQLKSVN